MLQKHHAGTCTPSISHTVLQNHHDGRLISAVIDSRLTSMAGSETCAAMLLQEVSCCKQQGESNVEGRAGQSRAGQGQTDVEILAAHDFRIFQTPIIMGGCRNITACKDVRLRILCKVG